jgi:hypothetical protein
LFPSLATENGCTAIPPAHRSIPTPEQVFMAFRLNVRAFVRDSPYLCEEEKPSERKRPYESNG